MTKTAKISYAFIVLVLLLVCVLHLATPFITMLFSYFALTKMRLGQSKGLAVTLFLILALALGYGFYYFVKQAYVALPSITESTINKLTEFAAKHEFDLPFKDYASFKELARETITEEATTEKVAGIGKYAKNTLIEVVAFLIGIVSAVSLFVNARFQLDPESEGGKDNLYQETWRAIAERFRLFYQSFATVMGAQMIISGINTVFTAIFLLGITYLGTPFPYATVIIVLTFLCGLLPIIGNLISNTLIVGVSFTLSPQLALLALAFLVVLHKLEYFLNSKIIGHRIRNPMWLTLLGLILGEKLMGVPGMILAPVVLHYIKVEASRSKVSDLAIQGSTPPSQP